MSISAQPGSIAVEVRADLAIGSPTSVGHVRPTLAGHLRIARLDHWVKNVFVLPGIVVAVSMDPSRATLALVPQVLLGMLAVGLIASSNYTLNEVLDAPFDRTHPVKSRRPVPAGLVSIPWAYAQWILLGLAGVLLGYSLAPALAAVLLSLWVMGCLYNVPPVRTKDLPYLDVVSEAVNNPIRLLAGWYLVAPAAAPPASLLISYWMVGCFFMAVKRYAELRFILDEKGAALYRRSFAFYTLDRLLVSIVFYASAAMLCFGAFIIRYRVELILAFPLVALVMSLYLKLGFQADSAAEAPEKLYRQRGLMAAVVVCTVAMAVLLQVDLPLVQEMFAPVSPGTVQGW